MITGDGDDTINLKTKDLDRMIKALKENMSRARVGILGDKNIRNDQKVAATRSINATSGVRPKGKLDASTNASLGAIHEFGGKMPMRSFLRMPISEKLKSKMEDSGAFSKDELSEVVKTASLTPWLKKIAILAVSIVHEAFDTGGFGKWPAWRTKNYTNDHNRILEDTGQLRDSITSDVK